MRLRASAMAAVAAEPRPFVMITPLGIAERVVLPVSPRAIVAVSDWACASSALYVARFDDERMRVALAFTAAWRASVPVTGGERWELSLDDYRRLVIAKPGLRRTLPSLALRLRCRSITWPTPDGAVRLHPFHLSDPPALAIEAATLDAWLCHGAEG